MTTPASAPPVRRREIFGWAMFDFANSSYTTIVVTVAFGNYFTQLVAPGVPDQVPATFLAQWKVPATLLDQVAGGFSRAPRAAQ